MEDVQTPILPFRVEDIRLNKALRYYLGSTQWLDASTPPLETHFESLIKRVRVCLPPEAGDEAAGKAPVSGHPLLHAAAVRAARQARFSPTSLSGQRVKVSGLNSL